MFLKVVAIVSFFLLSSCSGVYETVIINGLNKTVNIYLVREAPKNPMKYSTLEPGHRYSSEGPYPLFDQKRVAIFETKTKKQLYQQNMEYNLKSEKMVEESLFGKKTLYMKITAQGIKQIPWAIANQ